jgi:hypothetical protein
VERTPAVEAHRMTTTSAQRRVMRDKYDRLYRTGHARVGKGGRPVIIPDDIEVFVSDRPCFNCGERGGCRHRPWLLGL